MSKGPRYIEEQLLAEMRAEADATKFCKILERLQTLKLERLHDALAHMARKRGVELGLTDGEDNDEWLIGNAEEHLKWQRRLHNNRKSARKCRAAAEPTQNEVTAHKRRLAQRDSGGAGNPLAADAVLPLDR